MDRKGARIMLGSKRGAKWRRNRFRGIAELLKVRKQTHLTQQNERVFGFKVHRETNPVSTIETLRFAQGDRSDTPRGRLQKQTHLMPESNKVFGFLNP